jgi:phosphate transport system permease protein
MSESTPKQSSSNTNTPHGASSEGSVGKQGGGLVSAIVADQRTNAHPLMGSKRRDARRRFVDRAFVVIAITAALACIAVLGVLLASILIKGAGSVSLDFLRNPPSRKPEQAGIYPAMIGTIFILLVCAAVTIPLGVGTAVFLEEFKPRKRFIKRLHALVQLNITNLAGVPSVVYGILGMTVFVEMFGGLGTANDPIWELGTLDNWYYMRLPFGRCVLAGGLTLMLVILPIVMIASQEALRAVPDSLRQGAFGLGCTRWQMVWRMTLPSAVPGIMTGTILAMSRAIGEAAPILIVAGVVYITFTPEHLMDDFTAMPLQVYDWASRPQESFHNIAAASIIVLLAVLISFNAVAIFIRHRFQRTL